MAGRRIDVLSDHVCAQLYFLAVELSNARAGSRDEALDRDPALPFAIAFRSGAAAVGADVAFLETHDPVAESILEGYWMVLIGDATALAAEYFGLLYLDNSLVKDWDPGGRLLDRDKLPDGPGRTLFAQRGQPRWF